MKILLVYPYFLDHRKKGEDIHHVPMGLYYIGALLKENRYETTILDLSQKPDPKELGRHLLEMRPDVVGLSVLNGNRAGAMEIARICRSVLPGAVIAAGGQGATFLWRYLLNYCPELDVVVMGEGEHPFLNLVRHVEKTGGASDLDAIGSLAFRKNGQTVRTDPAPPVQNPDIFPNPAQYFTYPHVSVSRGCPFDCHFCGSPGFWKKKVRFHSPGYFVDQVRLLAQKGVSWFFVSDDTFALDKKRAMEICQMLVREKLNIRWAAITRVEDVDRELLLWMRKAGCVQISFGVESGSEAIRKALGKPIPTHKIIRAFDMTQAYGIMARAYFIYGCPGETDETIEETILLMKTIKPLSVIFYILALYPGTRLYDRFAKKFGVSDEIWNQPIEDILYFQTDPNLSADRVLAYGKRLRQGFLSKCGRVCQKHPTGG